MSLASREHTVPVVIEVPNDMEVVPKGGKEMYPETKALGETAMHNVEYPDFGTMPLEKPLPPAEPQHSQRDRELVGNTH